MTKKTIKTQAQATGAQVENVAQTKPDDKLMQVVNNLVNTNSNYSLQTVTGYTGLKFANKVVIELHLKKKAISHCTFESANEKLYNYLKDNKLILRKVPRSFGWRIDTECLITDTFCTHIEKILALINNECEISRNLKEKQAKKIA